MALRNLHEAYAAALDRAISTSNAKDFEDAFGAHDDPDVHCALASAHASALKAVRASALAELEQILQEHELKPALEKLDAARIAVPLLPDGTTVAAPRPHQTSEMMLQALAPVKLQHKQKLLDAVRQMDEENAELQRQYVAKVDSMNAISRQLAAASDDFQKTASECEQWRRSCA